jgi:hypothetical protein
LSPFAGCSKFAASNRFQVSVTWFKGSTFKGSEVK